jgi:hypothetical protein
MKYVLKAHDNHMHVCRRGTAQVQHTRRITASQCMEQSPNMPQYRMHCGTSGNCLRLFTSCSSCGTGVLHVRMYPLVVQSSRRVTLLSGPQSGTARVCMHFGLVPSGDEVCLSGCFVMAHHMHGMNGSDSGKTG